MTTKRIVFASMIISALICLLPGCYKVTTVVLDNGTEITEDVSLAKDIVPILNQNCSVSGCHNSGGIKPDLSTNNVFASLNNGGYINLDSPEQSEVYLWVTGKRAVSMPPNGTVNPSNLNQLIIAWIKQGASNN